MLVRRVTGASMEPSLYDGDIVITRRKTPKVGDVVIAKIDGREVIKRVKSDSPTTLFLLGDNSDASTDSRHYGEVPFTSLLGVVSFTFSKKWPFLG